MLTIGLLAMAFAASSESILINTEDLCAASGYTIVDTRPGDQYQTAHIHGAIHLDPDTLSEERDGVVGLLKDQHAVETLIYRAGIQRGKTIVVYSAMDAASDLKRASRLFWILETVNFEDVHVLDGGFSKWKTEGHPLCQGHKSIQHTGEVPEEAYSESLNTSIVSKDTLIRMQESGDGAIIDLRPETQYDGTDKKDFVDRSGHIKDAVNIPAPSFLEGDFFLFKDPSNLSTLAEETIKNKDTPVVTYCNTGRDATVGYLGLRIAGHKNVSVYDGSMAEWGNSPQLKMDEPDKGKAE